MRLGGRNVGVDSDPAAFRQGGTFDRDCAAIGAGALHIMGYKCAGLVDPLFHKDINIINPPVFATLGKVGNGVPKCGAGADESVGQIKHVLKRRIAQNQPQIAVINRQGLPDQVQARNCHGFGLFIAQEHRQQFAPQEGAVKG